MFFYQFFTSSRVSFFPIFECLVLGWYFQHPSIHFPMFTICIILIHDFYFYLLPGKVLYQTKNMLLIGLFGMAFSSFLCNIGVVLYKMNKTSLLPSGIFLSTYTFFYSIHMFLQVPLFLRMSKVIINQYQLFLIIILFIITSALIRNHASWYNWILLFYNFCLSIECSITATTKEFERVNVAEGEKYTPYTGTVHT